MYVESVLKELSNILQELRAVASLLSIRVMWMQEYSIVLYLYIIHDITHSNMSASCHQVSAHSQEFAKGTSRSRCSHVSAYSTL